MLKLLPCLRGPRISLFVQVMTLATIFLPYLFVGIVLTSYAYIPVLVSVAAKSSNFFPLSSIQNLPNYRLLLKPSLQWLCFLSNEHGA